ncbi:hypothetical protein AOQ84DRAFT_222250 [Glonium stellatum]|uniref:Uncharacterized protein n=1 Tax=Glonium stellatum TaxID=574774 RepID=A0A8E2F0H7_9PEZI|nr:hypothetical protein AOQ84DRAFT_222250 [Glonium stellatum]
MTTARKPPNKTRAFSEFHLEAGKVGRTSLEDSDFDIMEAVLSVVVLHMLDGVGESASVPAVAFSCPGRLLAGLPRRLYAGWEGSASFTINQPLLCSTSAAVNTLLFWVKRPSLPIGVDSREIVASEGPHAVSGTMSLDRSVLDVLESDCAMGNAKSVCSAVVWRPAAWDVEGD